MYFDSYATGKRIQHLRKANGMTQEELAVKLNTSDRHLRNLKRGGMSTMHTLRASVLNTIYHPDEQTNKAHRQN